MYQIVYVSSATVPFSGCDLLDLLARSREANARAAVTGLLLYKDGNFMQALEGEEGAVRATYARIGRDRRHRGALALLEGPLAARRFPGWSMAFRDLRSPEAAATPGFSAFLSTPLTDREFLGDPSASERLLLTFKRAM